MRARMRQGERVTQVHAHDAAGRRAGRRAGRIAAGLQLLQLLVLASELLLELGEPTLGQLDQGTPPAAAAAAAAACRRRSLASAAARNVQALRPQPQRAPLRLALAQLLARRGECAGCALQLQLCRVELRARAAQLRA